ncbi:probable membrane-associated kinase regulator 4 [Aristolochia californica]|uniref:probable membrane-associated kinase regulator 4 n=1 Tax=Aristolochia californica TaxID=171875 RepID=UPI0035DE89CE
MARDLLSCDQVEEEYIEMDVSSSSFFCYSPQSRDFEFQMSANLPEREPTTSPADELFYKGKLLPLHLPPRLQMVQKLLQNPSPCYEPNVDSLEQSYITATATPYESCNISPAGSCPVSRELNPDEYFYECGVDDTSFINHPKKSWSKKLKLIKQSSLSHKLKASRAYLRSLFTKSGCSDESSTDAAKIRKDLPASRATESLNKYSKVAKRNPFGQIHRERNQASPTVLKDIQEETAENNGNHRRSFSGAIKRNLAAKSSTSSSSSSSSSSFSSGSSNGFHGAQILKRSSSVNSEVESSIQGAIAHCKQSLQLFSARKSASEVGFCSLSASRIAACDNQEWPGMCRG